jgi:hypothetical protein
MKKILMSTAVVMLFASPAFAQSYSAGYGTGNAIDMPALEHGGPAWKGGLQGSVQNSVQGSVPGGGPYAYEPPRATGHLRGIRAGSESISPTDPDTVYEGGQYIGRDPDPNVRLELRRDWTHD